jgi:hypothetical protein
MTHSKRDEWQRDISARQRNVVFPDTAANEARFWRNLLAQRWNGAVIVGLALITLTLLGAFASVVTTQARSSNARGFAGIMASFGAWFILLAIGAAVLLIGWLVTRAKVRRRSRHDEET